MTGIDGKEYPFFKMKGGRDFIQAKKKLKRQFWMRKNPGNIRDNITTPVLRHAIGKSTFTEGIAVPRQLEAWVNAPAPSQKRDVILQFAGSSISATLRRLGNERAHVQIKYENKSGEPFRKWLRTVFPVTRIQDIGNYLELHKIAEDRFEVRTYLARCRLEPHLEVKEWIFPRGNDSILESHAQLREIPIVVQSVEAVSDKGQDYYNRQLSQFFGEWQWDSERKVIPELPLKVDFAKDDVLLEVEFGNARTYYQDYFKFMLAHDRKIAEVGVLMVPTEGFAKCLCSVGRRRAELKGRHSYSGMIHLEKVRRELEYLRFILSSPMAIVGIGIHGSER